MLQINEGLAQEIIHEVGATRTLLLETLPNFVKEWANWKTISGLIRRMKSILAKVRNKINDLLNSLGEKPAEVKSGPGPDEKVQRNPDIFGGSEKEPRIAPVIEETVTGDMQGLKSLLEKLRGQIDAIRLSVKEPPLFRHVVIKPRRRRPSGGDHSGEAWAAAWMAAPIGIYTMPGEETYARKYEREGLPVPAVTSINNTRTLDSAAALTCDREGTDLLFSASFPNLAAEQDGTVLYFDRHQSALTRKHTNPFGISKAPKPISIFAVAKARSGADNEVKNPPNGHYRIKEDHLNTHGQYAGCELVRLLPGDTKYIEMTEGLDLNPDDWVFQAPPERAGGQPRYFIILSEAVELMHESAA